MEPTEKITSTACGYIINGNEPVELGDPQSCSLELISSVLNYTCILDRDLAVVTMSDGMAHELGYSRSETQGKNILEFIDASSDEFHHALDQILSGNATRISTVIRYRRQEGSLKCTPLDIVAFTMGNQLHLFLYIDNFFDLLSFIERERDERVKELKYLYLVGSEMENARSIDELYLNISDHIARAMQFPEISSTIITLGSGEYAHIRREDPVIRSFRESIMVHGEKQGEIQVNYHADKEFLEEEYALVTSIAKLLGRAAERFELEKKRIEYTQSLEALVEERIRELEKSRLRYKNLFDNAPSSISISTRDGAVIAANPAFYRMLRYPVDSMAEPNVVKDHLYCNPEDRKRLLDLADA